MIMNSLTALYLLASIVAVILIIWSYTKPGKKWLKDL